MASNQSVVPSSNFLKLEGFTSSFENWQRPLPNATFPFLRGKMQKLLTPENSFLRGKKNRFFLLRAAVVFCCSNRVRASSGWSWFCCDVASSSQKPCSQVHEKALSPLGPPVLQKQPQKAASGAMDSWFTVPCPSRVLQCHETPSSQRRSGGWLCNACVYSCTFNSSFANQSLQM